MSQDRAPRASGPVRAPARYADAAQAAQAAAAFDLRRLPADYFANPYPCYHALREAGPVHPLAGGGWFLAGYAACVAAYKDARAFSSDKKREFHPKYGDGLLYEHHTTSLVFNDPPLHTRVRRIIAGAFTPRSIADMERPVTELVDGLLDRIERKGSADLIGDLAAAVPVEVIGNLLAVPREERGPLRDWSLAILGALEPVLTPAQQAAGEQAVADFLAYLETLAARRRASPGDPDRDVLTRLIQGEEGGERLSGARAPAQHHLHPQRRPRDHHQPGRQRVVCAAGMAGGEGAAHRPAGADPHRA